MLLTSKYLRDILIPAVASPIEALTMLYWPVHIETWLRRFAALARLEKLKNEKASRRENEIGDIFLQLYSLMLWMRYRKCPSPKRDWRNNFWRNTLIQKINNQNQKKNKTYCYRTKFIETRQDSNESIIQYVRNLKEIRGASDKFPDFFRMSI